MSNLEKTNSYDFKAIESKWQKNWEDQKTFKVQIDKNKKKFYSLVEFPFPSGAGLHCGHARCFTIGDVVARKKRLDGYNVLNPMGYDSFGMQAEQYAIKTGKHPADTTRENCATFTQQLKNMGNSYDWDRCVSTSEPDYYKWTQWMFIQFVKKGMAYKAQDTMNWCPSCKLALTNEELEKGNCERCGGPVEQKVKTQWTLKMQSYSDKLIEGLADVDYTDSVKKQQIDWIGKSVGAEVDFSLNISDEKLKVFTTRPDTIFGATYMVIAPEHPLLKTAKEYIENIYDVKDYQHKAAHKTQMERGLDKDKSGVLLKGIKAINPFTKKEISIFVSDYVMMGYGTGAIMAVPAHDQRDYAFAKKFDQEIIPVLEGGDISKEAFIGDGVHINSSHDDFILDGLNKVDGVAKAIAEVECKGIGSKKTNYKMKDWLFTRQRYWGEPIPMVYCEKCGWEPIDESELPLLLPEIDDYLPTEDGSSPLAKATDWLKAKCPKCGRDATRETDTMPNWAGSCWYFLRYMDAHNEKEFVSKEALDYWGQVDFYDGGSEHITRHLLYSRFWNKMLFDEGHVPHSEPFIKRTSHGMILAEDGSKMSKSKGNVVNPDDIISEFGADTLRTYEMFIGPYDQDVAWSTNAISGVYRFLNRSFSMLDKLSDKAPSKDELKIINRTIKTVGERIDNMKFNTAVSGLMECLNALSNQDIISKETLEKYFVILSPFAPHICEEAWEILGHSNNVSLEQWPSFDEKYLEDDTVAIVVSVNGKKRAVLDMPKDTSKEELEKIALENDQVKKFLINDPKKVIVVPNKLVNIVV